MHNILTFYYVFTVMRLGKKKEKEKETESKNQVVEGVSRLICSPKTHNIPLKCKYSFVCVYACVHQNICDAYEQVLTCQKYSGWNVSSKLFIVMFVICNFYLIDLFLIRLLTMHHKLLQ